MQSKGGKLANEKAVNNNRWNNWVDIIQEVFIMAEFCKQCAEDLGLPDNDAKYIWENEKQQLTEEQIKLVRYALASHNYYTEAYNYCKAALNAHT